MNESTKEVQAASYACTASEAWSWTAPQLEELNRKLDRPFGEVERFDQALAFTLWMDGHPVERWTECEGWLDVVCPRWNATACYRILPRREGV